MTLPRLGTESHMRSRRNLVRYWASWWLICLALWLLLTSTVSPNEVLTGVVAAALVSAATTLAMAIEPSSSERMSPLPGWAVAAPWRVLRDNWIALRALVEDLAGRRVKGAVRTVSTEPGSPGITTVALTMAPNTLVVNFESGSTLRVHELLPRGWESTKEELHG